MISAINCVTFYFLLFTWGKGKKLDNWGKLGIRFSSKRDRQANNSKSTGPKEEVTWKFATEQTFELKTFPIASQFT